MLVTELRNDLSFLPHCCLVSADSKVAHFFNVDGVNHSIMAARVKRAKKKQAARSAASRPAKRSSKLIKSVITDKQVNMVKKAVSNLSKDVIALQERLENDGAINMTAVSKIVNSAIKMQESLAHQESD